MLESGAQGPYTGSDAPKLRTACENCRQSKVKCNLSGKNVCTRCLRHGLQCQYGFANRSGKPKGSKNRATLWKLGQLQEDKPPMRGFRESRPPHAADRKPFSAGYTEHIADSMMDDDVCLISGPPGLWNSPRSFRSAAALETPICSSQLTVDGSPFADLMDPCPTLPIGLGYPHAPVTPTFLPSDPLADGVASSPFGGSASSPYAAPCECVDMQLFHMNRLNHLLAESLPLRFDHSLQTIKATFRTCLIFLQCSKCTKDSANSLLVISVLNLTLQLFECWISRETSRTLRTEHGLGIRYGCYELCQEENQQIHTFLLRGLLLQCREVLSMMTASVNSVCYNTPKLAECTGSPNNTITEDTSQFWPSPDHLGVSLSDLDTDMVGNGPGNNSLLPIIAGYEATVEAFLQTISSNECICGAKPSSRDDTT
ncbi:hypothetical protein N7476_008897 [Penicillium atrosanguineum]|uniref:Zn(2)-C6 fungal-type domain-containing protein n=1 Tax=Penicillium atrosanguineum TaxID=1132637 RepID=A0A9W9U433_9EURO|nr:hypothetical protein N7526_002355 [Penicillium atrosanguineum]KAJ5308241.1 hypothetical protein N7476_008897 [Penicillium atrosanguineum]